MGFLYRTIGKITWFRVIILSFHLFRILRAIFFSGTTFSWSFFESRRVKAVKPPTVLIGQRLLHRLQGHFWLLCLEFRSGINITRLKPISACQILPRLHCCRFWPPVHPPIFLGVGCAWHWVCIAQGTQFLQHLHSTGADRWDYEPVLEMKTLFASVRIVADRWCPLISAWQDWLISRLGFSRMTHGPENQDGKLDSRPSSGTMLMCPHFCDTYRSQLGCRLKRRLMNGKRAGEIEGIGGIRVGPNAPMYIDWLWQIRGSLVD